MENATAYGGIFSEEKCVDFLDALVDVAQNTYGALWKRCEMVRHSRPDEVFVRCVDRMSTWAEDAFEKEAQAWEARVPRVGELWAFTMKTYVRHQYRGSCDGRVKLAVPALKTFLMHFMLGLRTQQEVQDGSFFVGKHSVVARHAMCMPSCRRALAQCMRTHARMEPTPPASASQHVRLRASMPPDVYPSDSVSNVGGDRDLQCLPPPPPLMAPPAMPPSMSLEQLSLASSRSSVHSRASECVPPAEDDQSSTDSELEQPADDVCERVSTVSLSQSESMLVAGVQQTPP